MEKIGSIITAIILSLSLLIGIWWLWNGKSLTPAPSFGPKTYVEVVLQNGETYYGRIMKLNTPYPVLTETSYIILVKRTQTEQLPEGTTTAPIEPDRQLIKRGGEPQQPGEEMVLNRDQIVRISQLRPDSQVVQIMENWKTGK